MESLPVEKAYAKINLGLKILGRRPDGYHEILSVAQCVDLADILYFEPASSDQLTCSLDSLSMGPDNLVYRAVDAFRARLDRPPQSFRIHLEKNIPIGAGLGGGSADAAAVLRALNRFYDQPFSNADLRQIAATLGSDIPFLVGGRHRSTERPGRDARSAELGGRSLLRPGVPRCRDQHGVGLWPTRPHLDRKLSLF